MVPQSYPSQALKHSSLGLREKLAHWLTGLRF